MNIIQKCQQYRSFDELPNRLLRAARDSGVARDCFAHFPFRRKMLTPETVASLVEMHGGGGGLSDWNQSLYQYIRRNADEFKYKKRPLKKNVGTGGNIVCKTKLTPYALWCMA